MRISKLLRNGVFIGTSLFLNSTAFADNCTGYDTLVTTNADTRDLGNGMTLTTFQAESIVITEDSIYNLATGQCSGTALATPDGKVRSNGHCARHDKDGHTQSIEWSQGPGAERNVEVNRRNREVCQQDRLWLVSERQGGWKDGSDQVGR